MAPHQLSPRPFATGLKKIKSKRGLFPSAPVLQEDDILDETRTDRVVTKKKGHDCSRSTSTGGGSKAGHSAGSGGRGSNYVEDDYGEDSSGKHSSPSATSKLKVLRTFGKKHLQALASQYESGGRNDDVETSTIDGGTEEYPCMFSPELVELAHNMREEFTSCWPAKVKDRKWHLKTYKDCFLHEDAMLYLMNQVVKMETATLPEERAAAVNRLPPTASSCGSDSASLRSLVTDDDQSYEEYLDHLRLKAARLGNLLIEAGYMSHVCGDHEFYSDDDPKRTLFFSFCNHRLDQHHRQINVVLPRRIMGSGQTTASKSQPPRPEQSRKQRRASDSSSISDTSVDPTSPPPHHRAHHQAQQQVAPSSKIARPPKTAEIKVDSDLVLFANDFRDCMYLQIKDRRWHLKTYRQCFLHSDGLLWLTQQIQQNYYECSSGGLEGAKQTSMRSLQLQTQSQLTQCRPLRPPPPLEQQEMWAAHLGNWLIEAGYVSHVCTPEHRFIAPNYKGLLFFRFHYDKLDRDLSYAKYDRSEHQQSPLQYLKQVRRRVIRRLFLQQCSPPSSSNNTSSSTLTSNY